MVTTIQISEDIKNILQRYKKTPKDTYEDVIRELIKEKENSKENELFILREGYEEMYGISKQISQDFDNVDLEGLEKNE